MRDRSRKPVIPPFILDGIARNGTDSQQERARRTLDSDSGFRTARTSALAPRTSRLTQRAEEEQGDRQREISDCENTEELPGEVVRREGEPETGDEAADEAYADLGTTYDLFYEVYGRDSLDDSGLPLLGSVHYGRDYANAFWDGERMVFGDGDGELFRRFTLAVDVVAHELTHGVTQYESALEYQGQSGALNEHLSDVFGILTKQRSLGQSSAESGWLIGAELLTDAVKGVALRSMKEPGTAFDDPVLGKDPQPGHMDDYVETTEDDGGVHINSGIPNRAFYECATILGGNAWERAGKVWYETSVSPDLAQDTDFVAFVTLTRTTAARLYGEGSEVAEAVTSGWRAVGL